MNDILSRRQAMTRAGMLAGAGAAALSLPGRATEAWRAEPGTLPVCFNTATIRQQKVGIVKAFEIAARAGYQGVEAWLDEIEAFAQSGGSLSDLKKKAEDLGLQLPNAIGFFEWMVDDAAKRARALEQVRRNMDQLAKIGCRRVAAPPAGDVKGVDLLAAAERYRAVLEIGDQMGVTPVLEFWGSSPGLSRLGQAALIVVETRHPKACMLPDVFHLYRGGSNFDGFRHLSGASIAIFHLNDYPEKPAREEARDSHRVFPGDGVAPLKKLFKDLRAIGYPGMLSLELFNPEYYKRDPEEVAKEGYRKARAVLDASL